MKEELKLCPCCGYDAECKSFTSKYTTVHFVECRVCGLQTKVKATSIEAIEAWNRRV